MPADLREGCYAANHSSPEYLCEDSYLIFLFDAMFESIFQKILSADDIDRLSELFKTFMDMREIFRPVIERIETKMKG